jgi:hypothetical protein
LSGEGEQAEATKISAAGHLEEEEEEEARLSTSRKFYLYQACHIHSLLVLGELEHPEEFRLPVAPGVQRPSEDIQLQEGEGEALETATALPPGKEDQVLQVGGPGEELQEPVAYSREVLLQQVMLEEVPPLLHHSQEEEEEVFWR